MTGTCFLNHHTLLLIIHFLTFFSCFLWLFGLYHHLPSPLELPLAHILADKER